MKLPLVFVTVNVALFPLIPVPSVAVPPLTLSEKLPLSYVAHVTVSTIVNTLVVTSIYHDSS